MKYIIISFLIIVIGLILISYILTHRKGYPRIIGDNNREEERKSQYECGLELMEETFGGTITQHQYLKYFIIALIFLLFDLESLLLFPSSIIFNTIIPSIITYLFIILVLFIILLGLYYEYSKHLI